MQDRTGVSTWCEDNGVQTYHNIARIITTPVPAIVCTAPGRNAAPPQRACFPRRLADAHDMRALGGWRAGAENERELGPSRSPGGYEARNGGVVGADDARHLEGGGQQPGQEEFLQRGQRLARPRGSFRRLLTQRGYVAVAPPLRSYYDDDKICWFRDKCCMKYGYRIQYATSRGGCA